MENQEKELTLTHPVITPEALLEHWQGHRRLTRRVIEIFPEDALFKYNVGGMRTFSELAMEMISIAGPGVKGIAKGEWKKFEDLQPPKTKQDLLQLWDEVTEQINKYWKEIPSSRFQEEEVVFDVYEGQIWSHLFYFIDNEIHHRGQGYVYLRALGVEPPYFWLRGF